MPESSVGSFLRKHKFLTVAIFALVLIIIVGVVYVFVIRDNNNGEEITNVQELVEPISDFSTEEVNVILADDSKSNIEKAVELELAAGLKESVELYDEALKYKEAVYRLGVYEGQSLDDFIFELVLLSEKAGDEEKNSQYRQLLGEEKLREYETIKPKEDERGL